jgi:ABC-type Fe3+ transport system permease subunit
MALTWGTLIAGAVTVLGLPLAIVFLNARIRNAGWWLLLAVVTFVIAGNIAEKATTGSSALF